MRLAWKRWGTFKIPLRLKSASNDSKGSTAAEKVSGIIITSQEREVSLHTLILLKVFRGSLNQNKDSKQDSSQHLKTLTPKKCKQMNETQAAYL